MGLLRCFSFLMFLTLLASCGGGSLSTGEVDGDNTSSRSISLALSNNTVTGQAPVTVTATVKEGSTVISGVVVTFSSTLGSFSPSSGTALTNADGVATITLNAGDVQGAGTVTALVPDGTEASISFTTQGDGSVGNINIFVSLLDSEDNETDTITSSKPGKIQATINGISSPMIVTFTSDVGDIPISTAITDVNNQATVDIFAGGTLGAGTITASIDSGEFGTVLLVVGSSDVLMGSGEPFVEGQADISLAQISAGGTTVVLVKIVDDQGNLFTETVDVNFSSGCTSLTPATATLSSPITTSNGIATSTYLAKGCVGEDTINVTANAGGINLSANGVVNVLPADVGSIEFVSVTPENISILGTGGLGGSESSTVVFRILDTNSNPVNNQLVNFSLNTDVGGITLIPLSATTDNNGLVQTVINSGTVATSVRVQANIDGSDPLISSQSSLLVVSTGIPDQDSFSLSASTVNPEAWDIDGTEVEVIARLADAFNNPVPDGTAVSFTTEGGSIDSSCITLNGVCTVTWRSQLPKPEGHYLWHKTDSDNNWSGDPDVIHPPEEQNTLGQKYGGRATILATVIGEESFPDLNGNGRFDANEMSAFAGNNISGLPYDLKEAFVDHNEDSFFNPGEAGGDTDGSGSLETFVDFNNDGSFTGTDGKYNGVLCSIPSHAGCSAQKSLNVRRMLTLVMSTSTGLMQLMATNDSVNSIDDDNDPDTPNVPSPLDDPTDDTLYISGENSGSIVFAVADLHNQPMPAGTIITAVATAGSVVSGGKFVWPNDNHNGGVTIPVGIKGETEPKSGVLIIEAEAPSGLVTLLGNVSIVIQ